MKSFESLTPPQLRRAADIKEELQSLNNELSRIFGGSLTAGPAAPKASQAKGKMSPAAKAKLSAKLKAIWAKRKAAAPAAPAAPAAGQAKGKMSPAAKAKLSAKLKAIWAKRKAAAPAAAAAPKVGQAKSKMSPAAKAHLSAKLKAYWAKRKAAKKK